jgi:hypothetical protein
MLLIKKFLKELNNKTQSYNYIDNYYFVEDLIDKYVEKGIDVCDDYTDNIQFTQQEFVFIFYSLMKRGYGFTNNFTAAHFLMVYSVTIALMKNMKNWQKKILTQLYEHISVKEYMEKDEIIITDSDIDMIEEIIDDKEKIKKIIKKMIGDPYDKNDEILEQIRKENTENLKFEKYPKITVELKKMKNIKYIL